jgi:hypothetical protein
MSLTKALANKIGDFATSSGGEGQAELFKSTSEVMSKLEQTENTIIKKKIKKGDIVNNLSKKTPKMDKPIGKLHSIRKSEAKEATGAGSAGGYSAPLFTTKKKDITEKGEFKEATSSASSGSYETPAAWAKSTGKKDWRGKSKTQIPGGQFVTVKKKCKTFPYCNQGDINALKFTNEEIMNKSIKKLSKNYNISEELIKKLIMDDYHKIK